MINTPARELLMYWCIAVCVIIVSLHMLLSIYVHIADKHIAKEYRKQWNASWYKQVSWNIGGDKVVWLVAFLMLVFLAGFAGLLLAGFIILITPFVGYVEIGTGVILLIWLTAKPIGAWLGKYINALYQPKEDTK